MVRKPVLKTGLVRTAQSFVITRQKPTTVIRQEEKFVPRIGTVNIATNFVMQLQSIKDVMKTEN